jgi:hypothetical protein
MRTAGSKFAYGFCDRTGFRYPLKDLVQEFRQGRATGLRVGKDMVDPDHPQNWLGRTTQILPDAQALINPRPDLTLEESRNFFSFNPVGQGGTKMVASSGTVKVS